MQTANVICLQPGSITPKYGTLMGDFWQYGVGGLAVAIVGAAVKLWTGKKSHEATTETLNFEQVKYLLEESRKDMSLLRTQNEKLRDEVINLRTEVARLNAHIQILESGK